MIEASLFSEEEVSTKESTENSKFHTHITFDSKTFWLSLKYWFGWLIPASQDVPWTASNVKVHANCKNNLQYNAPSDRKVIK